MSGIFLRCGLNIVQTDYLADFCMLQNYCIITIFGVNMFTHLKLWKTVEQTFIAMFKRKLMNGLNKINSDVYIDLPIFLALLSSTVSVCCHYVRYFAKVKKAGLKNLHNIHSNQYERRTFKSLGKKIGRQK